MRIVLLAQALPPVGGSHATRINQIAKLIESVSNDPHIITISVGKRYPLRGSGYTGRAKVHRTFPGVFHAAAHGPSHASDGVEGHGAKSIRGGSSNPLVRTSIEMYDAWAIPDVWADWVPHAAASLRQVLTSNSVVISSSEPNSVHIAPLLVSTFKRFHWIADFGDPWTLDRSKPRTGIRSWLERRLERLILSRASKVIFTTTATLNDYKTAYPKYQDKMRLVRMGFDQAHDVEIQPARRERPYVFYGGTIQPENRSGMELLDACEEMSSIDFIFAGSCVNEVANHFRDKLPSNVILIPWLDHKDYISHVKGAAVNVILGNRNYQQVPGKVYQLLGNSSRILYIGLLPPEIDEAWQICSDVAVWCRNETTQIRSAVARVGSQQNSAAPGSQYSWANQMALLRKIIEDEVAPVSAEK